MWLPSSQSSVSSRRPLPQLSSERQLAEQPSPGSVSPSSQTSARSTSTTLSPHLGTVQSDWQPSPLTLSPSSQSSPTSRKPLPQCSFERQLPEQPSPSWLLPSSQTSLSARS